MDEQTIQQGQQSTSSSGDVSADGAAYQDYDTGSDYDSDFDTDYDADIDDGSQSETDYDDDTGDLKPDGIALDETGEMKVGDDFFGDIKDTPNDNETPNLYSEDELKNTPYEQWDFARLNGDVKRYAPIVRDQIQRRQAAARAQSIQNTPMPTDIPEPKQYTPKELSDEAMTLACQKLGLEDPDDFDDYEPEHRAAMALATQELIQKRNADMADYQRGQNEWGQLQQFNSKLAQLPDFHAFDEWYKGKLKEAGVTAEQVNAGLYAYARRNGNRFGVIPQIIGSWYNEFLTERGANNQRQPSGQFAGRQAMGRAGTAGRPNSMNRPPVLESTRGNDYGSRRTVNLRDFGEMNPDEQASALMRMGLV